jgi:hypothetical protein
MTRSMIGFAGRINSIHLKQLIYRSSALIFIGTRRPAWGARRECAAPSEPTAPVVGMPRHNAKLTNKTAISFRLIFLEYRFAVTTAAPLNLKHILGRSMAIVAISNGQTLLDPSGRLPLPLWHI